jgi:hypothetical protein
MSVLYLETGGFYIIRSIFDDKNYIKYHYRTNILFAEQKQKILFKRVVIFLKKQKGFNGKTLTL